MLVPQAAETIAASNLKTHNWRLQDDSDSTLIEGNWLTLLPFFPKHRCVSWFFGRNQTGESWWRQWLLDFFVFSFAPRWPWLSFRGFAALCRAFCQSSAARLWARTRPTSAALCLAEESARRCGWTANLGEDRTIWGTWTTESDGPPSSSTRLADAQVGHTISNPFGKQVLTPGAAHTVLPCSLCCR